MLEQKKHEQNQIMLENYQMFSDSYVTSDGYGFFFWNFNRNYLVVGTVFINAFIKVAQRISGLIKISKR